MTAEIDDFLTPTLWEDGWPDRMTVKDQDEFLFAIWGPQVGDGAKTYASLCFRKKGSTRMVQEFVQIDDDMCVVDLLRHYSRHEWDQYFGPNTYTRKDRKITSVSQECWFGWCDVDKADPLAFKPKPSVVWETSPGRMQALWFWDRPHTPKLASAYSKALTYRHGGDKGGSAPNKLLRLPGSFNHKPDYDKPFIPLLKFDSSPIKARPKLLTGQHGVGAAAPEALDMNPHAHDRLAVLRKYRSKLDTSTRHLIRHNRVKAPDRSSRIFAMVAGLHEAEASLDEIASVIWSSPYFREKHGDDQNALETEVSRIIARVGGAQ